MNFAVCAMVLAVLAASGCGPSSSPPATAGGTPTQTLQGFEMQDIKNGEKSMSLHAEEGKLYEEQHYADLTKPVVTFFKHGRASSVMTAPLGRVDTQTRAVQGWGGVKVVTADSTTLTTDRLAYDPAKRQIFSKDAVTIEKPDSITRGKGLLSDPEMKSVRILHQRARMK